MAMFSSVDSRSADAGAFGARLLLLLLTVCLALAAGCATSGNESDIPWNDPQPWEGSPAIPGLSNGNGRY